ncbi:MAG: hypothetical protein LDLANPLL_02090 [Turneriella sp.]|nr:hypothetical protein [Turneriella sp.]
MEEALKKALQTGVQTLISVTEEVRHALSVLDRDIQNFGKEIIPPHPSQDVGTKLTFFVEKSISAIREYEERATKVSQKIQKYLEELEPTTGASIRELSEKLGLLAKEMSKEKL